MDFWRKKPSKSPSSHQLNKSISYFEDPRDEPRRRLHCLSWRRGWGHRRHGIPPSKFTTPSFSFTASRTQTLTMIVRHTHMPSTPLTVSLTEFTESPTIHTEEVQDSEFSLTPRVRNISNLSFSWPYTHSKTPYQHLTSAHSNPASITSVLPVEDVAKVALIIDPLSGLIRCWYAQNAECEKRTYQRVNGV